MIRLQDGSVRAISLLTSSTIFSVVVLVLAPSIDQTTIVGKLVTIVIGTVSLAALTFLTQYLIVRFWWTREFSGVWYYESQGSRESGDIKHYAEVAFGIAGGGINYRVQTFELETIMRRLGGERGLTADIIGTAKSLSVSYDGHDDLEILYEYSPQDGTPGKGVLSLTGVTSDDDALRGRWITARIDTFAQGHLRMYRRAEFLEFLATNGIDTGPLK